MKVYIYLFIFAFIFCINLLDYFIIYVAFYQEMNAYTYL